MRLETPDVVAVEQQVELTHAERDHGVASLRLGEVHLLQSLTPQHEVRAFSDQDSALRATPIGEHEQLRGERVQLERVLHQRGQTRRLLAKIDGLDAQVNLEPFTGRSDHRNSSVTRVTSARQRAGSACSVISRTTPLGNINRNIADTGGTGVRRTGTSFGAVASRDGLLPCASQTPRRWSTRRTLYSALSDSSCADA